MPTTNRDMGDMLRKTRSDMEAYHYGGDAETETPESAVIAISAEPPPDEALTGDASTSSGPTLLEPGTADPPDQYVYAQGETPGSLVMYPPGVPCDTGAYRVATTDPATAQTVTEIQQMLDDAAGEAVDVEIEEIPLEDDELEVA